MPLKIITINIPDVYLEIIEKLVQNGLYLNRSDFARIAIDRFLLKETQTNQDLSIFLQNKEDDTL